MHEENIRDILLREILGEATVGDHKSIDEWLSLSDNNRELYERLHADGYIREAISNDDSGALREDWDRLMAGMAGHRRRPLRRVGGIAAAVAIPLLIAGTIFFATRQNPSREAAAIADNTPRIQVTLPTGETVTFPDSDTTVFAAGQSLHMEKESNTVSLRTGNVQQGNTVFYVPRGGNHKVRLEDGTIVHLNSQSELSVPVDFTSGARTVYFHGEGYFEVAHDAQRPFTVKTRHADVSVLGTEFNLRAYEGEPQMVTTLVEGSVEICRADSKIRIAPGQQARVNGEITVDSVDIYPHIAWKSGRIVFEDTRTEEIMESLRRLYDYEVHYENEAMKERLVTLDVARYPDIRDVLDPISKVNKTKYTVKGREIFISSR